MKIKILNIATLIIIESLLFICIIYLGRIIFLRFSGKVKGFQYISRLNKQDFVFDSENNLKYFYEPKPNSIEKWNPDWLGYEVDNKSNNDGLNERYNYPVEKSKNVFRIITLGDSFTYGHYVKTNENYTEVLEDKLNSSFQCSDVSKFEIINLGVPGYDLTYEEARFGKRGLKYNPDLVIWYLNNWNLVDQNELIIPEMENISRSGLPDFDRSTGEYRALDEAREKIMNHESPENLIKYDLTILDKMHSKYTGKVLLILNSIKEPYKSSISNYTVTAPLWSVFDSPFNTWNSQDFRFPDGHPNSRGHQQIAESIFLFLRKYYFANCKLK